MGQTTLSISQNGFWIRDGDFFINVENNVDGAFAVMDTMEQIYLAFEDYADSYEVGVIQNNRAAAWLTLAISEENDSIKREYLSKARAYTDKGINIFTTSGNSLAMCPVKK